MRARACLRGAEYILIDVGQAVVVGRDVVAEGARCFHCQGGFVGCGEADVLHGGSVKVRAGGTDCANIEDGDGEEPTGKLG